MNQTTTNTVAERIGRIGIIGAGKVGVTLGLYFKEHGFAISGYHSRTKDSAIEAANLTNSTCYDTVTEVVQNSDTLFITVPDGQIKHVWDHMKTLPTDWKNKIVCHASGSLTSQIFSGLDELGGVGYSVHPLFAISDKYQSYKEISKCVFTIEGRAGFEQQALQQLLQQCGNEVVLMDASKKALYHAAAVAASNFTVGLSYIASGMLEQCGFSKETASSALIPLMLGSIENVKKQGAIEALTGPVERNDVETIENHLKAFSKDDTLTTTYKDMTKWLIKIAKQRHDKQDYTELEQLVN